MPRAVPEWIGKTPDTPAPPRVRQRVWEKHNGTCHICSGKIDGKKWDADHVKAIINGGENREINLAPAHQVCHKGKTAKDVAEKAAIARKKQKASGAKRPKGKMQSAGFEKSAKVKPEGKPSLPPRRLFESK